MELQSFIERLYLLYKGSYVLPLLYTNEATPCGYDSCDY